MFRCSVLPTSAPLTRMCNQEIFDEDNLGVSCSRLADDKYDMCGKCSQGYVNFLRRETKKKLCLARIVKCKKIRTLF